MDDVAAKRARPARPGRRRRQAHEPPGDASARPRQLRSLVAATHPRLAVATALVIGAIAYLMDRPAREAGVAFAAVLLVQLALGLLNDVCDRELDTRSGAEGKPIASGAVPVGNATWLITVLLLLSIPVSLQNGTTAGLSLLATVVVGAVHDRWLHRGWLSFVGWAATYALYPAFLAYGGWGGGRHGSPPTVAITVAAAVLGLCVHLVTSLPDLVADNRAGIRSLPLRIALKIGAPRLLVLASVLSAAATVGVLIVALGTGVRQ